MLASGPCCLLNVHSKWLCPLQALEPACIQIIPLVLQPLVTVAHGCLLKSRTYRLAREFILGAGSVY